MRIVALSAALLRDAASKGFFHLFSANILINVLAFGSQLMVVKFLSPAEMADIKTLQSFTGIAVIVAGFGFNSAILKLCSENREPSEKQRIFTQNLRYTLYPTLGVIGIVVAASLLGLFSPQQEVNRWMIIYMLTIPATVLSSLVMMYVQALKKIKLMATYQTILRLAGVVALVLITYFAGFSGYVFTTVAIGIISLFPLFYLVRGDIQSGGNSGGIFKESWHYAGWSLAANLVYTINGVLDIVMLNYMLDDRTALGYYSIATIFILGLNQVTATIQSIATPYFSGYATDQNQFMRIWRKYQRLMVAVSFAIMCIAMLVVPVVITWFYGSAYSSAGAFFRILSIKYFLWSALVLPGLAIWGIGKIRYSFYSAGVALLVSLFATYFLIGSHGVYGAAVAQVLTYALMLVMVSLMARFAVRNHFRNLGAPTSGPSTGLDQHEAKFAG